MTSSHAVGLGDALPATLTGRGAALSPEDRARIGACRDDLQLSTWLHRAVSAKTASDVFEARRD